MGWFKMGKNPWGKVLKCMKLAAMKNSGYPMSKFPVNQQLGLIL
jgi:hypothetical protein